MAVRPISVSEARAATMREALASGVRTPGGSAGRAGGPGAGRPPRPSLRELGEHARLDAPVAPQERHRPPLGILPEHLDDIPCEVETVGHLPATVVERGRQRELARGARNPRGRAT